ncbi:NAD-dependent DNA ligase LigA [Solirubrobacter sp. CPCC 204708]|uniref:DNA ligase n=1 Tax=Solirubrobacter deserti TaxID=2282478 RepID=A0ABT4RUY5_9ACTN|nr:NAD-dependent DNA ligase LigA [Solirubrobacter deserti]MBE2316249.1 NAD-dependent DNA ligase LigA [Solirubrobacter deserti]MDA0142071.1 NAD-dependent DNA ligase LigA [Solirubrobacter deserti]
MKERIEELARRITELRAAYYDGAPQVADAEYDALEDELRELLAAHPEHTPSPNPLEAVGAPSVLHAPVRHSRPMLSLEKATKPEQVEAFFERFPGQSVVVMPKLDGLSLALVYEDGRLARAVTRGDGTTGDDVTVIVRALADGVPSSVELGGRVEVRGEAVMLRSTFAAYNEAHPDKPLINPRNAAAGTVRAKDPAAVAERRLHFFAFDLDASEGAEADLEAGLKTLGFDAADMRHCSTAEEAQQVISAIEAERAELDYDLDGAVLRLADRSAFAAAGTRSSSPRGALAYKFAAEEKTTVLSDVVWDVGKTGKIAPVAWLEPVFVGGTTVTRATLANQEVIRARGIKIGDTVLVRRAGDVIPFVAGVLDESKRTGEERDIIPPSECPSCGEPLTERGESRELFCTNLSCPAQTVRRLIHWASRAAADIEAVGPVWIERLAASGDLVEPSDFYALTKERLLEFDRIGEVSAERMIESIEASKNVGLRRAVIGLAIPMASEGTAARLCRAGFRSLEEVADAGEEKLVAVEDIGPKVAESLTRHLERVRPELEKLRERGVSLDVREEDLPPEVAAGAPLEGKTVVITGAISDPRSGEKVPRPAFQRLCERAGATAASSVSASTDMLITGADVGASKIAKAEKLEVAVVDQSEIWQQLISAGIA